MAILLTEGFDWCETADMPEAYSRYTEYEYVQTSTQTIEETGGRNGAKAIKMTTTGGYDSLTYVAGMGFPATAVANGGQIYIGFAVKFHTASSAGYNAPFCLIKNNQASTNPYCMNLILVRTVGGLIAAGNQTANSNVFGTTYGVSTRTYSQNIWHYVEIGFVPHDTTGSCEVWINGVQEINATGIDTIPTTGTNVYDQVLLASNNYEVISYDDLYIADDTGSINNDFLGDIEIETLDPDGNGNASDFVGSDADSTNNYLLVDDGGAPDDDTTYTESATSTDQDLYTYESVRTTADAVLAAVTKTIMKKTTGGSKEIMSVCRSSTTETDIDLSSSTDYTCDMAIYEVDPNTSSAWTTTNFNSAEFGVEIK